MKFEVVVLRGGGIMNLILAAVRKAANAQACFACECSTCMRMCVCVCVLEVCHVGRQSPKYVLWLSRGVSVIVYTYGRMQSVPRNMLLKGRQSPFVSLLRFEFCDLKFLFGTYMCLYSCLLLLLLLFRVPHASHCAHGCGTLRGGARQPAQANINNICT